MLLHETVNLERGTSEAVGHRGGIYTPVSARGRGSDDAVAVTLENLELPGAAYKQESRISEDGGVVDAAGDVVRGQGAAAEESQAILNSPIGTQDHGRIRLFQALC